jgi:hypothetical protein
MAEREGFEPSVPILSEHTISNRAPSAARASLRFLPIRFELHGALNYVEFRAIAMHPTWCMAEGVGFEPTSRFTGSGFQDRRLKPLGHPSAFSNFSLIHFLPTPDFK